VNRAILLKREEKFADAIAEFQQVLASNPMNLKARVNFGGTLLAGEAVLTKRRRRSGKR